jgi:ligand-binding sensor domain-containing protein
MEDGLPSNDVHAVVQTENGFLWVGTDAGLARFDGKRFTPINIRGGVAQQIPVRSLLATPEGRERAIAAGFDSYIAKRINLESVRNQIRQVTTHKLKRSL